MSLQRPEDTSSATLKLLNITGSPFAENKKNPIEEVDDFLLQYAVTNRMHLFFLESLKKHSINAFSEEFRTLTKKLTNL